ncbi:peroxisomal targeting signal 2 receptor [Drosophila elegans]|uniref:peroxisomal targeting signal 2 receptor n=1 Tax=Drosophila elegans TaxID=30023 RepID=UPI0007E6CB3C|nr:peroxisomal targeting signal 2 receptor [Drosophila elegans]
MQTQTHTTTDRHGYSLRFSPFEANYLLLATSQMYGLAGGGSLFLLEQNANATASDGQSLGELCRLEWSDGLFDVAWCPYAADIAATASGDGSLQIWCGLDGESAANQQTPKQPLICLQEHKNEVYSLDWGEKWNYHTLLSASWDCTLKLWDCNRQNSITTFVGHNDLIYGAKFSPLIANLFASVSTDGHLNLWNSLDFAGKPLMSIEAHASEALSCDWSHFDRNVLVTGGSDGLIRGWDLRKMRTHVFELYSGEFAVRRLACSPHSAAVLASANYDFTTRIWNLERGESAQEINAQHTEFVCGVDWNPHRIHQLADCGWDSLANVYTPQCLSGEMAA